MKEKFSKDMSGIFQFKVIPSGECFIGSSASLPHRFRHHLILLTNGNHPMKTLQEAWNTYGPSNVSFSILEIVKDRYGLPQRELFWLHENHGIEIEGKPTDTLRLSHSPGGHISVQKEIRDSVRALGHGTMVSALRWLIEYYEQHTKV